MKKINFYITSGMILSNALLASTPMGLSSMSKENGGTKDAIDAYSDGGWVLLVNKPGMSQFDNSAMNQLVFKFGDQAKKDLTDIKQEVLVVSATSTQLEKDLALKLNAATLYVNPPINGTTCDDNNAQTANDIWANSICQGVFVDGASCDDGNSLTYGEKYSNNYCNGIYATS